MVKRIDKLTDAQTARMGAWADKWIEIGLRTGNADRALFEDAARRCYEFAGLKWHGNVVWVSSPIVVAIAGPIATALIQRRNGTGAAVGDAVRGAVGDAVGGAVRGAVRDAVGGAVRGAVHDAVRDAVGGAVRGAVGDAVGDAVGGAVRDAVGGAVRGAVGDAVGDAVRGAVGAAVRDAVVQSIRDSWSKYLGGQFWVGWWWWGGSYTSFFREVCGLELQGDLWDRAQAYEDTMQAACWWYPHSDFIIACERPTAIKRELVNPNIQRGWGSHRLHSLDGPAVGFRDGWGVYAVHGVRVPADIIEDNSSITVARIESETNAEVRRVMIDLYKGGRDAGGGPGAYLTDSGATIIHEDLDPLGATRRLLRKEVPDDEAIVMIDVQNSTQEPDGSWKRYQLRVDPKAYGGRASKDCLAAIASTWRDVDGSMIFPRPEDYAPGLET